MLTLLAVFLGALLQDVFYTTKTAFVAHGRTGWAMGADATAMAVNYGSVMVGASTVVESGMSWEALTPILAYGIGGALGTGIGMLLSIWLEKRTGRCIPHHIRWHPYLYLPCLDKPLPQNEFAKVELGKEHFD